MYYMHPQLENDTFDNGLLCAFLVWLSCFQFLGLSNPNDKEVQKNVGTIVMRALGNSSHIKCSFLSLWKSWQSFLASSQLQGIPWPPTPATCCRCIWSGDALSSRAKFWLKLNVPKYPLFFFFLFLSVIVPLFLLI